MGNTTCCKADHYVSTDMQIIPIKQEPTPAYNKIQEYLSTHAKIRQILNETQVQELRRQISKKQALKYNSRFIESDQGTFITPSTERSNLRNGYGVMIYRNESLYEGQWRNGIRDGKGVLANESGQYYCGDWLQDMPHGTGIYRTLQPQTYYSGCWANGLKHGQGEQLYQDGSKYTGWHTNDQRQGHGRLTYPDETEYEGEFRNNSPEGIGIFKGKEQTYEGSWKGGKMHGSGISKWYREGKVIATYLGEYKQGIKQGYGEYTNEKGVLCRAMWKKGEIDQYAPIDIQSRNQ